MSQRSLLLLFVFGALISFFYAIHTMPREADILFINATIYTLDPEKPVVQAVAVKAGRIVSVGSTEELIELYKPKQVVDLSGKTMMPGFIDGHAHMNGLGELLQSIVLVGVDSPEKIARLVRERVTQLRPGEWVYGRGWDQNLWANKQFPTKSFLDAAAPNNPVILGRIDGHAIWVNSRAIQVAGVTRETKDPEGGKIIRDPGGNPTGIFIDNATPLIENVFPPPTSEEIERSVLLAAQQCVSMGLTEVHDMDASKEIDVYQRLVDEKKLPLRIYLAINSISKAWEAWIQRSPLIGYRDHMLNIRAVKMYMDGALGSRGAALFEEYGDDPGNRGLTTMSEDSLERAVRAAIQRGYQPCTHAIGDRANHIVLNVYEKVLASVPRNDYRMRIEHAQVLAKEDISRFKKLGVLPSMQPVHCTSDMYWAELRLGPQRVKGAYAWRSILDTGSPIISGSDFPNDNMSPLLGFYAAITRSDQSGYPAEGWYGKEKMTREEALKAFTLWPAYGAFQENMKGTIEYGKYADLTVLSKDIMTIQPQEILTTEVEMTIVGGKIMYQKPSEVIAQ